MHELLLFVSGSVVGAVGMTLAMQAIRSVERRERHLAGGAIQHEREARDEAQREVAGYAVKLERLQRSGEIEQAYRDGIMVGREDMRREIDKQGYMLIQK